MFVDLVKVNVSAGKGGDGAVSFRREKFVDRGGPDGGDGGKGGDVIFEAARDVDTLINLRFQPELSAKDGGDGAKQQRTGKSGNDLIVRVPVGTVVKRDGRVIADFVEAGQREIIARGGAGGFGNEHFKSSVRQAPTMAERGEPGEAFLAELELKMLADVGLIGLPNAGKSTLLSVISNAKPEIADYEFTTLVPNLGVVNIDNATILVADIPGLIEGASQGKGLGSAFLRHVERTAVFVHLIDAWSDDPAGSYKIIRQELLDYSPELANRPEIVVLSKIDGLDEEIVKHQTDELTKVVDAKTPIVAISAHSRAGVSDLLRRLIKMVAAERRRQAEAAAQPETVIDEEHPIIELSQQEQDQGWSIELKDSVYHVSGVKIEKFSRRTNYDNWEGLNRLRDILRKLGIAKELIKQGAVGESLVQIGADPAFTFEEVD